MLEVNGLDVYYGDSHIVRDLSLAIAPGQLVCLMGRNGVGKTTLLRAVMGLLPARSGRVCFGDHDISREPPYARARRGIGYVPQGREIIPNLTVEENLLLGLEAAHDGRRVIPSRLFELFPVLPTMLRRRGGDLSGGQQQQLALARALASGPKLLLLDEPTEGIQPSIIQEIIAAIRTIKEQERIAVLWVEQHLTFVRRLADQFLLMERGAIVAAGPVAGLSDDLVRRHLAV